MTVAGSSCTGRPASYVSGAGSALALHEWTDASNVCKTDSRRIPHGDPYLFARGAARLIQFLSEAFGAQLVNRKDRPDGAVMHAELRIGDSMLMLGDAAGEFGPMPTSIYLYVTDCDRVYRQALIAGGLSISEVMNFPSGERYGGVKDPAGNIWWIATHVEDVSEEEQEKRWRAFRPPKGL